MKLKTLSFLLVVLTLTSCATRTRPVQLVELSPMRQDVPRLLKHPEFKQAAKAAPNFVNDVLTLVAELNHEVNRVK